MDTTSELVGQRVADVYLRECASRSVLQLLANKWTFLVLGALADGPQRFGVLLRRADGITQKSLTQTLRGLERDGLLSRTVYPTIPPRVEYELTDLGRSVGGLIGQINVWAEANLSSVVAAREEYDEHVGEEPRPVTR
ncbi:winged helix-turn-helix transcriptional regulator [Kitasatospora indigofera]|uniref:Transcriptional regulator n=1 Tax=Kitasatospora indigofera TaxID=67307 RepID=A0A919KU66_9ACTN|nr:MULTISPECIES: helix-turn-helix domain-containing protein [Kitasatospora]MDQ0311559.1 DNA-binding HxlR family transcriptional regulator [Kitasatospora herbaricolor]GGU95158.1 transcriptional regulator [Kitasatospora herbaricolor]GHH73315.1 transcriptional regulator [Kitasatospora indigofera]